MKIYVKEKDSKGIKIVFPLGLASFILKRSDKFLSKYVNDDSIKNIDKEQLSCALKQLKRYKGLKLVEVKSADGTEVTIIV